MKKFTKIITALALCFVTAFSVGSLAACGSGAITFEICDDESNGVRAFQLLEAKGVFTKAAEGDNYPVKEVVKEDGEKYLTFNFADTQKTWTSKDKKIKVTLVAENLLVSSMADYDYALLPCNTAYTGKVSSDKRAAVEDDKAQVEGKANIIAARKEEYNSNAEYKKKIDALTNAMLSTSVSDFFKTKYLGAMTCDSTTQIDLRTAKDATVNGSNTVIKVCASDVPHAEVLTGCVKSILAEQGYDLQVTILDWTLQNNSVSKGDYDANYFQHVPYLETYTGKPELFAVCKVHYEPLGIYYGKTTKWKFS